MSWRETLAGSKTASYTYNTYKSNSTYCTYCTYRDRNSETDHPDLLKTLADACRGLDITPVEAKEALAPEDIEDWRKGAISSDTPAVMATLR